MCASEELFSAQTKTAPPVTLVVRSVYAAEGADLIVYDFAAPSEAFEDVYAVIRRGRNGQGS
jgi:hypothetical protein